MKYQRIFDARHDIFPPTDHYSPNEAWQEERGWQHSSTARQLAACGRLLLDCVVFLALFFGILTACGFVLSQLDQPIAALPATTLVGPSGRAPFTPATTRHIRAHNRPEEAISSSGSADR